NRYELLVAQALAAFRVLSVGQRPAGEVVDPVRLHRRPDLLCDEAEMDAPAASMAIGYRGDVTQEVEADGDRRDGFLEALVGCADRARRGMNDRPAARSTSQRQGIVLDRHIVAVRPDAVVVDAQEGGS